jgi:cytochrome oxidase assembly protein ShyY1
VFRGLLTPRWVGLLALLLVVVAACVLLGLWQLGVARDEGRKDAVAAAAQLERAPLQQVTRPHAPFAAELSNRQVTVTGTYAAERTFVVVDRRLGSRAGSWVVTPLQTQTGTIAVLRGFVDGTPAAGDLPPTPSGVVSVTGTLGPGESPRDGAPLPSPQRRAIDLAELVNEWPGDLYNAVVLASAETTGPTPGAGEPISTGALTRVPPPGLDTPLNLRNAAYAVQWWVFGVFAIWMWWKMFRAEQQGADPQPDDDEGAPHGAPDPSADPSPDPSPDHSRGQAPAAANHQARQRESPTDGPREGVSA